MSPSEHEKIDRLADRVVRYLPTWPMIFVVTAFGWLGAHAGARASAGDMVAAEVCGWVFGYVGLWVLNRIDHPMTPYYPVVTLSLPVTALVLVMWRLPQLAGDLSATTHLETGTPVTTDPIEALRQIIEFLNGTGGQMIVALALAISGMMTVFTGRFRPALLMVLRVVCFLIVVSLVHLVW